MEGISVKNVSTATVIITSDTGEKRFRRELIPGRKISLNQDDYEELMFDPGFVNLIRAHYIKVDGVPEETAVQQNEENVFEVADIEALFAKKDYVGFAKFIPKATMAEKETTVELAIKRGITDPGFTSLIKNYCGVDVIQAISFKHQAEEK